MKFLHKKFALDRAKRINQQELAEKLEIGIGIIKQLELGKRKTMDGTIERICAFLGMNPGDYFIRDCKIISVLSNKGGSSKTTTAVNLAYALATYKNKKVLLIDSDMQQNTTQNFDIEPDEECNFYKAFTKKEYILNHVKKTDYINLDIVICDDACCMLEMEMASMDLREYRFRNIMNGIKDANLYDVVIVDCNPSLNLLNKSILYGSDYVLVPLVASAFGLRGIGYVMKFVNTIKDNHPDLNILGILIGNYDKRKVIAKNIHSMIEQGFGLEAKKTFNTIIPTDTSIEQSQFMNEPVSKSFERCRASLAFMELADEVIKRTGI